MLKQADSVKAAIKNYFKERDDRLVVEKFLDVVNGCLKSNSFDRFVGSVLKKDYDPAAFSELLNHDCSIIELLTRTVTARKRPNLFLLGQEIFYYHFELFQREDAEGVTSVFTLLLSYGVLHNIISAFVQSPVWTSVLFPQQLRRGDDEDFWEDIITSRLLKLLKLHPPATKIVEADPLFPSFIARLTSEFFDSSPTCKLDSAVQRKVSSSLLCHFFEHKEVYKLLSKTSIYERCIQSLKVVYEDKLDIWTDNAILRALVRNREYLHEEQLAELLKTVLDAAWEGESWEVRHGALSVLVEALGMSWFAHEFFNLNHRYPSAWWFDRKERYYPFLSVLLGLSWQLESEPVARSALNCFFLLTKREPLQYMMQQHKVIRTGRFVHFHSSYKLRHITEEYLKEQGWKYNPRAIALQTDWKPDIGGAKRVLFCCQWCLLPETGKDRSFKYCSGCKLVRYCGREHQELDWKKHRFVCRISRFGCIQKCSYDGV